MVYSKFNILSDQYMCMHVSPFVYMRKGGVKGRKGRQSALGKSLDHVLVS